MPGTPPVVIGPGSIDHLADLDTVAEPGPVVLVVDGAVVANGFGDRAVGAAATGRDVHVHVVPAHEPTAASVDAAADVVRATGAAVVVGIGGGTALDTAKQAAVVAGDGPGIERYALGAHQLPAGVPVVA
ncbi:MAG: iron-containing alcohol dehydrogenase, partial [Actinomycetes bacterium]